MSSSATARKTGPFALACLVHAGVVLVCGSWPIGAIVDSTIAPLRVRLIDGVASAPAAVSVPKEELAPLVEVSLERVASDVAPRVIRKVSLARESTPPILAERDEPIASPQEADAEPDRGDALLSSTSSSLPDVGGHPHSSELFAYLEQVRLHLQARLVYPSAAKRLRLSGTVIVRFVIDETGSVLPESIHVERSSGVPVLDRAAASTVLAAAPFPRPAMGGLTVRCPVVFSVQS